MFYKKISGNRNEIRTFSSIQQQQNNTCTWY